MVENQRKLYVYCSGPLFCPEEIGGMSAIAAVLEEAGFGTFGSTRSPLSMGKRASVRPLRRSQKAANASQRREISQCRESDSNRHGVAPTGF